MTRLVFCATVYDKIWCFLQKNPRLCFVQKQHQQMVLCAISSPPINLLRLYIIWHRRNDSPAASCRENIHGRRRHAHAWVYPSAAPQVASAVLRIDLSSIDRSRGGWIWRGARGGEAGHVHSFPACSPAGRRHAPPAEARLNIDRSSSPDQACMYPSSPPCTPRLHARAHASTTGWELLDRRDSQVKVLDNCSLHY
jgi:hypothetical protein